MLVTSDLRKAEVLHFDMCVCLFVMDKLSQEPQNGFR